MGVVVVVLIANDLPRCMLSFQTAISLCSYTVVDDIF